MGVALIFVFQQPIYSKAAHCRFNMKTPRGFKMGKHSYKSEPEEDGGE